MLVLVDQFLSVSSLNTKQQEMKCSSLLSIYLRTNPRLPKFEISLARFYQEVIALPFPVIFNCGGGQRNLTFFPL